MPEQRGTWVGSHQKNALHVALETNDATQAEALIESGDRTLLNAQVSHGGPTPLMLLASKPSNIAALSLPRESKESLICSQWAIVASAIQRRAAKRSYGGYSSAAETLA